MAFSKCVRVAWSTVLAAVLSCFMITAGPAMAGDTVVRGPEPAWVSVQTDLPAGDPASTGGLRMILFDAQYRVESDSQHVYVRTRSKALSAQAIAAMGNVGIAWNPAVQDVVVHHVNIERDGQIIDVLDSQGFETLRREQNLEQATLDGRLTALLQPQGLRVGDVLDVAYTLSTHDPVIGDHAEIGVDLNLPMAVDRARLRASWPTSTPVRLSAWNNWTPLPVRRAGGYSSVEIVREGAAPVTVPVDAPGRLQRVNLIELSDYRDWAEVAAVIKPLYDEARRLEPDSPLHAEIARIKALSDDPAVQAAAALRLVQEDVRYVALLMGAGALTPASADETWRRRFGDCKGKTALLLALLDGLGIAADPAAVSSQMGDGMPERLPMVGAFDHVLVRAVVAERTYWLDGTGMGVRTLADATVPPFHWALPLLAADARLEALDVEPLSVPESEFNITVDASAGRYAPAPVVGASVLRGGTAALLAGQIGLIPAAQRDEILKSMWVGFVGAEDITEVRSDYDAEANVLTLSMKGSTTLTWPAEGLVIPGSTYVPLGVAERPEGAFKDAPHAIVHPTFSRQTATLRLPDGGRGYRVEGGRFDRAEFGHQISRTAELTGDTVTVVVVVRSLVDEITAETARADTAAARTRPTDRPRVVAGARAITDADREALAVDQPTTEDEWLDRALLLSRAGDFTGAVQAADKAVELSPQSSAAWANRGVYRFWAGDLVGATSDLERAVDIDPSERVAMNGNALLAAAEGRYQDAIVELSRALRQVPGDVFALNMRSVAYEALKDYDRALRDIDALILGQPENTSLKLRRITVLNVADRDEEADREMAELARAYPDDRVVLLNHAALLKDRDRTQEASDVLDGLLARWPDDQSALMLRADASIDLGRLDLATRDFDTVRAASPDDAQALNGLCWTAAVAGVLLDQALKDCDAALALAPTSPAIIDSRGRVLLQRGDIVGAIAAYDEALAAAPDLPASLYGRGLARIALGQVEAGEADKAAALALDPRAAEDFESYRPAAEASTD